MASVTSWNRLEIHCRDTTLVESLQVRVHDPLWLLARQWQVGEFTGDDGGSPVQARVRIDHRELGWYAANGGAAAAYDPAAEPLEARVEREPAPPGDLRLAIAGGRRLLGFLQAQGGTTATRLALLGAFAVLPTAASSAVPDLERERLASAMAGRAISGERVYAAIRPTLAPDGSGALPPGLPADPALLPACRRVPRLVGVAHGSRRGSGLERSAHGVRLRGRDSDQRRARPHRPWASRRDPRLALVRCRRRRVDPPGRKRGCDEGSQNRDSGAGLVPRHAGARLWEVEDGSVDLGAIDATTDDLARLLVMEFALVYGNDFFVVPVRLPVGSVSTVSSLVITDSFGVRTLIDSAEVADGGTGTWSMYRLWPTGGSVRTVPPSRRSSCSHRPSASISREMRSRMSCSC